MNGILVFTCVCVANLLGGHAAAAAVVRWLAHILSYPHAAYQVQPSSTPPEVVIIGLVVFPPE